MNITHNKPTFTVQNVIRFQHICNHLLRNHHIIVHVN